MRASEVSLVSGTDSCELQAKIFGDALKEPFHLRYRFPAEAAQTLSAPTGDFLVAALLLPAMKSGEPIDLPHSVSRRLYRSLYQIQSIFLAWDPTLSRVKIRAPLDADSSAAGEEVGLFFSLGVDSQYSLWRHTIDHPMNEEPITQLILVHGADLYLSDCMDDIFRIMLTNTRRIAAQLNKGVVSVTTNAAELLATLGIRRGFLGHEAVLASVGLILQRMFKKIYVATGNSYADLAPSNAHPILTPLWSTTTCQFVCDGIEARRLDKTIAIAESTLAMATLRVCWAQEGLYNCGHCAKCLRTMLALHVAGALPQCQSLPNAIDLRLLRKVRLVLDSDLIFFQEIVDALDDSELNMQLRAALLDLLRDWQVYFERLKKAIGHLDRIIPRQERFILVDRDTIRWNLGAGRAAIPFIERGGQFWGAPESDEAAIREVERLRGDGARFMVFWWTDYWWLEYYAGFGCHLRSKYRRLLEDDSLIIFDLGRSSEMARAERAVP